MLRPHHCSLITRYLSISLSLYLSFTLSLPLVSTTIRRFIPILRAAALLALLTLVALALAYQVRSRIVIDVGGAQDDFFLRRFFDPEGDAGNSYRWSQGKARVELQGQQVAAPWILRMRLNGFRPNRFARVQVMVNETLLKEFQAVGEWAEYEFQGNAASDVWSGDTTLSLTSDTFVPQNFDANNKDTRRLGIALDWLELTPARSAAAIGDADTWIDFGQMPIVPPLTIGLSWAAAFGILYASARGLGLAVRPVNLLFALLIVLLAFGFALWRPYLATYTTPFLSLALTLAFLSVAIGWLVPRIAKRFSISLDASARALLCAIVLLSIGLKWGGVWYPQFRSSDLTFHGHRLEFVASGNLFFTSELPDAARRVVPYPPSLYVTLAPFTAFIPDFEALLLLANVLFDASAIIAFYFAACMILQNRKSKIENRKFDAPLFAAFLFTFNPVSFWIYSWGNHTNIFGQATATLLFCILLTQSLARPRNFLLALFFLLLASTAHLGVFLSLLAFFPLAILFRLFARDENAKRESIALALVFVIGVVLASVLYYAEFTEPLLAQTQKFVDDFGAGRAGTSGGITLKRVSDVLRYTWEQLGWVLLVGGVAGILLAWKYFSARPRAVWFAWLVVGLLFGLVTVGSSFSTRYTLWAAPALALSGGLLLAWLFEKSRVTQFAAYALCAFAFAQTLWLWVDRVLNAYQ